MKSHDLPVWRVDNAYAFLVTLIGGAFTILTLYFSLVGDVREIKQDVTYIKEQNRLVLERYISLENRYGELALQIKELQTVLKLK